MYIVCIYLKKSWSEIIIGIIINEKNYFYMYINIVDNDINIFLFYFLFWNNLLDHNYNVFMEILYFFI